MLIRVKVGGVEIEYSQPTEPTLYPVASKKEGTNETNQREAFINTVREICSEAVEAHRRMYET